MHFVKTTLSLFVLASLTSGQSVDPHDAVAVRSTEEYRNYIAARDEFVEALGLYRRVSEPPYPLPVLHFNRV
jgi:hypothetical protein